MDWNTCVSIIIIVSKLLSLAQSSQLCQIVSLQYLSRSSLHRLAGLYCRPFFLWYPPGEARGPPVVFEVVDVPCPVYCWIYMTFLSSPWPRCWTFCPCMWCWAYFFPFWIVRPQSCSVLNWWVSMSLHHMTYLAAHRSCTPVSSGSWWQGWFWRDTGVWRMPPSLLWFFDVSLCPGSFPWCCSVFASIHFLSTHCSRWFGVCLQPSPLSLRCSSSEP